MKASPAQIVLAVFLLVLAVGAATIAYLFPATLEDATTVPVAPPKQTSAPKVSADDLQAKIASLANPAQWNKPDSTNNQLFISDGFIFYANLYPGGNYLQKDDGKARTPGGVLINWYRKYGLDFTDPNIDREDPDGDGFSNKTEFMSGFATAEDSDGSKSTNPIDGKSHPDFMTRLRLLQYESTPFHIQFLGYQKLNGQDVFQIYLKDVSSEDQPGLKKTGDPLGYEDYVVGPFTQNIVTETDPATHLTAKVDRSTLELDKPTIGFKILLTFRQEVDSPESTADFVMLMPGQNGKTYKVARGKTFSPPYLSPASYLLLQVKDDGATIRDTATNQEYTVPKLDPKEWDDVPVPASPEKKQP
jgi:hypothetical protein